MGNILVSGEEAEWCTWPLLVFPHPSTRTVLTAWGGAPQTDTVREEGVTSLPQVKHTTQNCVPTTTPLLKLCLPLGIPPCPSLAVDL